MRHIIWTRTTRWLLLFAILLAGASGIAPSAQAQQRVRAYIPPDQLVSFLPSTPFDRFTEYLNPIFERVTGKSIVDPETREHPIGISISGMHFLDALELVLQYNDLEYRETDRYFMIQQPAPEALILDADAATGTQRGVAAGETVSPATLDTRQIEIKAVLFELNHTKAKDSGIDWSVLFGSTGSTGGGGGGSGSGGSENSVSFFLKTEDVFKGVEDIIDGPDQVDFKNLNSLFRLAENVGVGETIANPSVTVQSGQKGDIQIGSDVPVQIRDTFGNISTQYFKTGIIIEVTPTLIEQPLADTLGSPMAEFLHLQVKVEKSGSRPSASGPTIDRSLANTQLLMLDGEQTVIGGLYSTEESSTRRGVPILKDMPKWFFGFRYIFGRTQRQVTQKELVISLEANVVDPIRQRMTRGLPDELLESQRDAVRRTLERFDKKQSEKAGNKVETRK
jgi:Flp pilus assembly secretin CpaC